MQKKQNLLPVFYSAPAVYSFDKPKRLSPYFLEIYDFTFMHFHSFIEFGLCLEGEGICCVEGTEYSFKSGDVQVVFPFQRHLSRSLKSSRSRWLWLNVNPYALMEGSGLDITVLNRIVNEEMALCGIFTPEAHPEIAVLVTRLFDEVSVKVAPPHFTEMCAVHFYEIILALARESQGKKKITRFNEQGFSTILPAVNAIANGINAGEMPTIEKLSVICSMSPSTFRKFFKQTVGINPKDYIIKIQLHTAKKLLVTTNKGILEIGLLSGFKDVSGLNRHFLEQTGMTPGKYRKRYTKS